ncbi:MAG: hypothetical protein ACRDTG_26245 [Pseudonocardiaceae bacterium]
MISPSYSRLTVALIEQSLDGSAPCGRRGWTYPRAGSINSIPGQGSGVCTVRAGNSTAWTSSPLRIHAATTRPSVPAGASRSVIALAVHPV